MRIKKTLHPGRIIRQSCFVPHGLTVTKAAEVLGVSRQAINNLVNERAGISPEMAIRLSKAFGGAPETWLQLQMRYDLAEAQKQGKKIKAKRYDAGKLAEQSQ